ncbi:hypothetical protein BYT27DRAFT_6686301 [Phlegmacium glaucopus]|nr:hypothetical protein BYT27DRAFT_6686301 [Phlegmacium glaucopus]
MSVQIFPPEILDLFLDELASDTKDPESQEALLACTLVNRQFCYQASSYIFSSLTISTQKCLDALLDILKANPDIGRHIRSFAAKDLSSSECLSAVFGQLCRLKDFRWIGLRTIVCSQDITLSISSIFSNSPYLTVLHFENMTDLPLSLFSFCCHLKSLILVKVCFAKIRPKTSSGSLFPSLRWLGILGPWSYDDDEVIGVIMAHAAPTLTTFILCDNNGSS